MVTTGTSHTPVLRFSEYLAGTGDYLAHTNGAAEQLWLLGGMAVALVGAGVVALAAARGRRND